jgi:hypothetical protein
MKEWQDQTELTQKYFQQLDVRPCCILDLWKARNRQHYLGVAVAFIDDNWKTWAVTLFVKQIVSTHTSQNIKTMVVTELEKLHINPQCYVADNASNQVRANNLLADWSDALATNPADDISILEIYALGTEVPDSDISGLVNSAFFTLPTDSYGCHCHHLELIIKHGLQHADNILQSIRSFATSLRNKDVLGRFVASFNEGKKPYLPADVSTRWSSTYRLLDSFLESLEVIQLAHRNYEADRKKEKDPELAPLKAVGPMLSGRKLKIVKELHQVLTPIAIALNVLEGDLYPTLSLVQLLGNLLKQNVTSLLDQERVADNPSDTLISVYQTLLKQLDERFVYEKLPLPVGYMPVDYLASALDPRVKHLFFLSENDRKVVWDHLANLVRESQTLPSLGTPNSNHLTSTISKKADGLYDKIDELLSDAAKSQSMSHGDEVSSYRLMPMIGIRKDPLAWWKEREGSFPALAKLARIYLSFPASSATIERTFSRGSLVMNNKRVRLHNDSLESQIVTGQNRAFIEELRRKRRRLE